MAGSYNHCITDKGKLRKPSALLGMLDATGCPDVYEAIEEMYGMIWYLAEGDAEQVEQARHFYKDGLILSPGVKS